MEFSGEFAKRFVIVAELVKRPSATIYKATDRELNDREVAIKIFFDRPGSNAQWIERFEKEMSLLRGATHPVLVPIVASGCENGVFYLAMELLAGRSVREMVKENEYGIDIEKALAVIQQVGEGLAEIHQLGTIHGHLDSRAVLFKGEEVRLAGYYPKVIDEIHRSASSDGRLIIDAHYIAPEQITASEKVDCRADVYALTVLLFEMLTGKRPFSSSNPLQTAMRRLTEQPPAAASLNKNISPLLNAAVSKGLSRNADERFMTVADFLDAALGGRKAQKNPFVGMEANARLSTETIAVSMSTDALKAMLKNAAGGEAKGETKKQQASSPGATMEAEATMIGVRTSTLLKASFVLLNGKEQGKRFSVERSQLMIGSDPSCDICISEKDVPKRYAIVTQRENDYVVEPMSPKGLTMNDGQLADTSEVLLKRGDVISAGAVKLRFVAPGEIFTLRESVVDRAIDRPQSRVPRIAMAFAAGALCLLLGFWYLTGEKSTKQHLTKAAMEAKRTKEVEALVAKLSREGDEFYTQGKLFEPLGENAKEKYEKILELDSGNLWAKKRMSDIQAQAKVLGEEKSRRGERSQRLAQLQEEGERYFNRGDYVFPPGKNARETYQQMLNLDPANQIAKNKIVEIDGLINDLLSKEVIHLARARVFKDLGQYVDPEGENALAELQAVLKMDQKNERAKNLLLEIAAESIYEGDVAKRQARSADMKREYLTAQALGVDPKYIENRLRGSELMQKSKAEIIIFNRQGDEKNKAADKDKSNSGFLDTSEIERRVAAISVARQSDDVGPGKVFIDLGNRKGSS